MSGGYHLQESCPLGRHSDHSEQTAPPWQFWDKQQDYNKCWTVSEEPESFVSLFTGSSEGGDGNPRALMQHAFLSHSTRSLPAAGRKEIAGALQQALGCAVHRQIRDYRNLNSPTQTEHTQRSSAHGTTLSKDSTWCLKAPA